MASVMSLVFPAAASVYLGFATLSSLEQEHAAAKDWHRQHHRKVAIVIIASCCRIETLAILRLKLGGLGSCGQIEMPMPPKCLNFLRFAGWYHWIATDVPHLLVGIALIQLSNDDNSVCNDGHWWLSMCPWDPTLTTRALTILSVVFSCFSMLRGIVNRTSHRIWNRPDDPAVGRAMMPASFRSIAACS